MLVEFALVLPLLTVFLVGLYDFGLAGYQVMNLRSAARTGAEYVSLTGDLNGVPAAVANAANVDPASLTINAGLFCECLGGAAAPCDITCPEGTGPMQFVSVEVAKPYLVTLSPLFSSASPTLSGSAILRVR
jgi:hypothetical protein